MTMLSFSARKKRSPVGSIGLLVFASIATTAAQAHDGTWTIMRVSGNVQLIEDGVALASFSESMAIRAGTGIRTGENGRIMLTHAGESMMITPNSTVTIPDTFKKNGHSTLLQRRGTVLFEVENDQVRPFQVLTPYLAAVVKGTEFSVTLTPSKNFVEVAEGRVEVTEFRSGQTGLVSAGQSAVVETASEGLHVIGAGFLQPIRQGVPLGSPDIPDVDVATSTEVNLRQSPSSPQPESDSGMQKKVRATEGGSDSGFRFGNDSQSVGVLPNWFFSIFSWRKENVIPLFVGFAVACGVAMRRKKKRNEHKYKKDKENDE